MDGASPEQSTVVGVVDTCIGLEQDPTAGDSERVSNILAGSNPKTLGMPIA